MKIIVKPEVTYQQVSIMTFMCIFFQVSSQGENKDIW